MNERLIKKAENEHRLDEVELALLLASSAAEEPLAAAADRVRKKHVGDGVHLRGLIEFSNICRRSCLYCGLRRENEKIERFRLPPEEIVRLARNAKGYGYRTVVLQGGEDGFWSAAALAPVLGEIRAMGLVITLSIGERSHESYQRLFDAGADRYLLRHETADEAHYRKLHPAELSLRHRLDCLEDLKRIGYQVGCGFMVGSPGQTLATLAEDLRFIQEFKPAMCGIGPFIPQHATVFRDEKQGDLNQTLFLLSLLRILQPNLLLPATTALGTIHPLGREMGIQAGANVVMPNLSPVEVRKKYLLYDNIICTGDESAACRSCLSRRMESIGYRLTETRGDAIPLPSPSALE